MKTLTPKIQLTIHRKPPPPPPTPTTTLTTPIIRALLLISSKMAMYVVVILVASRSLAAAWTPDVRPELVPKQDKIIWRFFGNSTDNFKILDQDDNSILIGARNVIYNVSLNGLRENYKHEWRSSDADRELCALKGKMEQDCHNYIRVFARIGDGHIMLCGTNSYKPRCRYYSIISTASLSRMQNANGNMMMMEETIASTVTVGGSSSAPLLSPPSKVLKTTPSTITTSFDMIKEVEAQGLCPYSPSHNSTYVYTDGQLYSATVADFSGSDPLIYREHLRTEQYDLKQLNQPDFVGAAERNGYVFFFFREISMEYMNCGKAIYSRVGRVCKNDRGGPYTLSKSWTSFLKARLNCSVPGEYPFYFDEIQATSKIIDRILSAAGGSNNHSEKSLIYAVFTTSANAIPGSAICAFRIDDILQAFNGRFKSQKDSQSNWLPVHAESVPEPRPGQCVDDSRTLSSTSVNFVKNHPLMEIAVPALYGQPLLKITSHHRLTSIAVDPNILALDGKIYDVIYTGTDDGKVIKFMNIPPTDSSSPSSSSTSSSSSSSSSYENNEKLKTIVISEMQVLPTGTSVRELIVSYKTDTLVAVSDGEIVSIPLHHCANIIDCQTCLALQDPNCAWDLSNHECRGLASIRSRNLKIITKSFIQSLNTTKKIAASLCPKSNRGTVAGIGKPQQMKPAIITTQMGLGGGDNLNTNENDDNNNDSNHILIGAGGGGGNKKISGQEDYHHARDNGAIGSNVDGIGGGGTSAAGNNAGDNDDDNGNEFILNGFTIDNKITLTSVDPEDLMNSINDPLSVNDFSIDGKKLQLAGKSFYWGFGIMILSLVFIVGMVVGLYASRRICKTPAFQHGNHRNQLSPNSRPFQANHRNSGKDVNLLVNSNPFSTNIVNCNHKKDNLEQDFVGEKDRSHECKNSTENLEKEIPCKTSTLTKVKRTYI